MLERFVDDVKFYDTQVEYTSYQKKQAKLVNAIYSYERLTNNIVEYYKGNIDFK